MTAASGPRGLFLDMDGTLAASLGVLERVYLEFLARRGLGGSAAEFAELNGPSIAEVVERLRRRYRLPGEPEALLAEYRSVLEERYAAETRANQGARELLDFATGRGLLVAVVTSGWHKLARSFLERHGFLGAVDLLVGVEDAPRGKPFPDLYLAALKRAGLAAREVLAVEDSPAGVAAAAGAGLAVWWLGGEKPKCPPPPGARGALKRLDDLIAVWPHA